MAPGARIRKLFGRHEARIADLWRAMFFDLDAWTAQIRTWQPRPRRILEVGCGEGYSTARLAGAFPDAEIMAIDIAPNLGRLFPDPPARVTFRIAYAEDLAAERPGAFDLIVMADVLHHVPDAARGSLLAAVSALLAPQGVFAFKDWARSRHPIHWLCWFADRYLTGDRIAFLKPPEARRLLASVFADGVRAERRIAPWPNNYAFLIHR